MKRNFFLLACSIASVVTAGCAMAPVTQGYKVTSYDKAWSCAVSTASQMGVSILTSSKESGTLMGNKNLDDVSISLVKDKGSVTLTINRFSSLYGVPTSGNFPQDFQGRYGVCLEA